MSIIKIKRSSLAAAPTALALGEFGYTYGTGTQANGGDRLYLGTSGETAGVANAIDVVGGKYFANLADHVHGTLTASSAIIVDSNSKIDILHVDNLTLNTNTLSSTNTNGNIILDPAGTGVIQLNGPVEFSSTTQLLGLVNANGGIAVDTDKFTVAGDGTGDTLIAGTLGVSGETTLASAIVSDLTDNRIVIAGTSGAIEDDSNFTFDGTSFKVGTDTSDKFTVAVASGDTLIAGTVGVSGESTLASAIVSDLTNNRIVIAGTSGAIEDDSNFTFDGTTFTVGATTITQASGNTLVGGTLETQALATLNTAVVENLTDNRIVIAGSTSNLEDDSNFTFDGTTFKVGTTSTDKFTVVQASGNTLIAGTLGVSGESTLASAIVSDLTDNRIVIAGASGAIEDDGNLTFDGSTFTVTAAAQITGVATVTGQLNVDNIRVDGNTISTTDTNGNIVLTPNGTGYVTISGTNGLVIPSGTNLQQAPEVTGAIRYNSDNTQFEGYSGTNWSSLGGVRSVDGFTYIIAESSPAASDDILHFYASNAANNASTEVAQLDIVSQRLLQTTTSTSNTTGALVVAGGVGIAENLNVGGDTVLTGDLQVKGGDLTTNQTTFNLINTNATTVNAFGAGTNIGIGTGGIAGGDTNIGHDLTVVGNLDVGGGNFTVAASTGHVETAGNMIIGGDLTVNGTRTTVNVDTLDVEDALIRLANGNTGDAVDIGFIGRYNDGADKLAGIFRDATSNEFFIFDEYVDTDVEDNVIDRSNGSFVLADTNVKAIKFDQKSFSLTGDVAGTINMSDMGDTNHTMAVTIQANSVALGTDTTGNYIATIVQATGGQTDANSTTSNGIVITGSGSETSAVTVGVNIADAAGAIGTSTYNATNFDVSTGGIVTIDTIDGGTF